VFFRLIITNAIIPINDTNMKLGDSSADELLVLLVDVVSEVVVVVASGLAITSLEYSLSPILFTAVTT
jgi:hypothetical protein